ncbi:MAG: lipid-A-disaccharide synthase [Thermoanaerobaculia bacterium]
MKLCVVAGEASGDLHASEVVREIRKEVPALELFGIGSRRLIAEGLTPIRDSSELAIVGLFNVLRHLPMFRRAFADLISAIRREKPDGVLLVDYPDFNLRVARECRKLGIPVFYYISPQVWAWRKGRVGQIARRVDHMFVIFPFEEELYAARQVPVTYVGHPLAEQLAKLAPRSDDPPREPYRIAILPGSRRMEIESLLPAMLDAVDELARETTVAATLLLAPTIDRNSVERHLAGRPAPPEIIASGRMESLRHADAAICSSGTAALECAVLGVPPVIVYRLSPMTYALARFLVRLPNFSLVNIVAGKKVVPELMQSEVTGPRIARELALLLEPTRWAETRTELAQVRAALGGPGAARRTAHKIVTLIRRPAGEA